MLKYMTCCEHPQTIVVVIIVVMETPMHSSGQQLVKTCHTFTESHRDLITPKQEIVELI